MKQFLPKRLSDCYLALLLLTAAGACVYGQDRSPAPTVPPLCGETAGQLLNLIRGAARRAVHDQAGGPVIKVSAAGEIAYDGHQSPSANKLLGKLVGTGRSRGDRKTKENQEERGESSHRKAP